MVTTINEDVCPKCGSKEFISNDGYGYHTCLDCDHIWAYDKDDPDYEEVEEIACPFCGGSGMTGSPFGMEECRYCNGSGFSRG